MSNILSFVSIKGGVGKTTIAIEVATSLVKHFNKKVLLVDANFSAPNIHLHLNLTSDLTLHDALSGTMLHNTIYETHGIDIIPASLNYRKDVDPFKLKKLLQKYKKRYDFIILDSSPNYQELIPIIATSDQIFLVTSPDHVTLTTTLKAATLAQKKSTPVKGIIINKIRSPKHEYNTTKIEQIYDMPVLAKIPDHKKISKALYKKTPISILDDKNKISKEIKNLSSSICGQPEPTKWLDILYPLTSIIQKEKINRDILRQEFYDTPQP
jgi:MinD-like ATPase involved in chromosome partitioning or flagellar assembly